jgi:putative inorganic carbon (HCO3(-)) transporter
MRDILVTLLVLGGLPFIFKRPWFGGIMWVWISVMNLHSQAYGFARTFPFAAIIAGVTVTAMLLNKEKFRLPNSPLTVVLILFFLWMSVTSMFAIHPDQVSVQWIKVYKIFAMNLVIMMLITDRRRIEALIATVVLSIGFYGVKGGLFTIRSGGGERVWGPDGTFIAGNNEIALALVVIIPLMFYFLPLLQKKWMKYAMLASVFLCALAALGTYSRGAALALGAMGVYLWFKSKNKLSMGFIMLCTVPVLLLLMPEKWFDRIDTINTYEEDASSMGRINAWKMAWNLASDRFFGGGFEIYDFGVFAQYAPNPNDVHAAHSIYFQVLGEHGFVGLFLYLLLGILSFLAGSWIIKHAKPFPDMQWAVNLARMLQVSLLGFVVGGAFLSLAYFDVPYYLMGAMVAIRVLVARREKEQAAADLRERRTAVTSAPLAAGAEPSLTHLPRS